MSSLSEVVFQVLALIVTAISAFIAKKIKNYFNDTAKKDVAETCVLFVEQVYKDLHGEEKLSVAISAFSEMLAEKGIKCTELEMRALLEAALASFNNAFEEKEDNEATATEEELGEYETTE